MGNEELLKNFMLENFDFEGLVDYGLFEGIEKYDFNAQADKICKLFGYSSIYEYGAREISVHLTFFEGRPLYINEEGALIEEPFLTIIPSNYD